MELAHVSFKARISDICHLTIMLLKSCFAEIPCLTFLYFFSQISLFFKLFISSDVCLYFIYGLLSKFKDSFSCRFSNDLSVVGLIACRIVTCTVKFAEFQSCGSHLILTPVELHQWLKHLLLLVFRNHFDTTGLRSVLNSVKYSFCFIIFGNRLLLSCFSSFCLCKTEGILSICELWPTWILIVSKEWVDVSGSLRASQESSRLGTRNACSIKAHRHHLLRPPGYFWENTKASSWCLCTYNVLIL